MVRTEKSRCDIGSKPGILEMGKNVSVAGVE